MCSIEGALCYLDRSAKFCLHALESSELLQIEVCRSTLSTSVLSRRVRSSGKANQLDTGVAHLDDSSCVAHLVDDLGNSVSSAVSLLDKGGNVDDLVVKNLLGDVSATAIVDLGIGCIQVDRL